MMKYLEMVKAGKATMAIMAEADAAGFEILKVEGRRVTAKAGCLPVEISWEMCSCHGGRLWLTQEETRIHIELSSGEYDVDNGVDSPETELAWRIENELADTVRSFEKFVHVVDVTGGYGNPDRKERSYFDSIEKAARHIFDEWGHDLLTEYGEVVHQYPNPDIRLRVTYEGDHEGEYGKPGTIRFKCERLQRKDGAFEVDYGYTADYWVYRKGRR